MPHGVIVLLAMMSPTSTAYGPELPVAPAKPKFESSSRDSCADQKAAKPDQIVVCAPRADGYRINPDVMKAKREANAQRSGVKPRGNYKDTTSCGTVGPFGCVGTPTIDFIQAAAVLATMAHRAATGGNVGQMFVTNPQKSEYELYKDAKAEREAADKAAAAAATRDAARAAQAKAATAAAVTSVTPKP